MLTAEGMRERYLLGRYNRQRYVYEQEFLSEFLNPEEIYMQSTNVNRTMQSGYSELMGLYPPQFGGNSDLLTKKQVDGLASGFGLPPFKVSKAAEINFDLGFVALPHDFTAVPIRVYNNDDIHDDCSTSGCPYINDIRHANEDDNVIWNKYQYYRDTTREAVAKSAGLPQEEVDAMTFHTYEGVTDADVARQFEGVLDVDAFFTPEEWLDSEMFQRFWLSEDFGEQGRDLMLSRMLRKPLAEMDAHIS